MTIRAFARTESDAVASDRRAGVRRRFAPPPATSRPRRRDGARGVPLIVVQRQLGHSNPGITSIYRQGIDNAEIIEAVHARARRWSRSAPHAVSDGRGDAARLR
jgi:integrase